jgi:hypothetical protein
VDAVSGTIEGEGLGGGDDVGAWLASVARDPVKFAEEGFAWGEGELANSSGPEPWQLWVLEQIRDGLLTPGQAIRVTIASGHCTGKSCVAAWITLWAMSTAPDTRGIVTASSESMLYTRFRAELRTQFRRFRAAEHLEMSATSLLSKDPSHEQTWRIDLLPWNANRPEAFAGLHNKGRRILVIFDEASAIEAPIWETVEAISTDADAEVIWLAMGNPLHPEGRFKDCFDKYRDTWITRHISSLSVSFTNKAEFARWARDYGEDSDFYRTRVLGEFPKVGSDQFISPAEVDAAMARELDPSHYDPLVIGVDVARYGSDESVIFPRKGRDCRSIAPLTFRGLSLDRLEDHVVAFMNAHPDCSQIFVDGTGLGGGLVDHLIRRGYHVTDVQFAGKAIEEIDGCRYANQRAHIWAQLRHNLRYLCLPANNQALKEQLTAPEYSFNRNGEILLEPKDAMRRRGVPSPDLADALACTYGGQISSLPALAPWVQGRGAVSEYNPFQIQEQDYNPFARETGRAAFVDVETGYQFRMKSDEWSSQDHADAWASDALRGSQPAPEPSWPSSSAGRSLYPKLR